MVRKYCDELWILLRVSLVIFGAVARRIVEGEERGGEYESARA
jgi:hypothetical protein